MNNEVTKNVENSNDLELQTSFEALHLSSDSNKVDPQNEILDVKKIITRQNISTETVKDLVNTQNSKNIKHQEVNISCCGLTETPSAIFTLKYLTVLDLSNNYLEDLPKEIGCLCNLLTLKLSGNKLESLPTSLKNIQHLNYLDLSFNKFTVVPEVLCYSLRTLTVLDLSYNKISKFDDPPGCLNKMVALFLSNNFFNEFPIWIFDNLCQLQYLDISQNQFRLDNKFVNYCKTGIYESLHSLNLENCNLTCRNLGNLSVFKKLKKLHLGNGNEANKNSKCKNYMGNLNLNVLKSFQEVTNLYLQNVQMGTLPTDFVILKNIQELDLSSNLLTWLPECFCELISLKVVNLTSNQILFLPVNIGKLINLKQVHLANNKLIQIPDSFYSLSNLEYVDFYNNDIEKVESKIFKEKNLRGMDLGLNRLFLDFCENSVDIDETKMLYCCLRDSFRNQFGYTGSRCDLQIKKSDNGNSETSSDQYSACSFESELPSDSEDSPQKVSQPNYNEDDEWVSEKVEEDELFDPNEIKFERPQSQWWSHFQNNYCPANYHVPPVMKTYIRNFKLASKNENVEEGQFDSD